MKINNSCNISDEQLGNLLQQGDFAFFLLDKDFFLENISVEAFNIVKDIFPLAVFEKKISVKKAVEEEFTESDIRSSYTLKQIENQEKSVFFNIFFRKASKWISFHLTTTNDSKKFCFIKDITAQKELEQRLVTEKNEAENLKNAKSLFLANVTHELRTPIQTIIGTTELLSETKLDSEQIEYLKQIQFSADVLLSLVNDVLDFSKMESNAFKIEYADCNIVEVVENTIDLISLEAHKKNLEIITNIDYSIGYVNTDANRVQQILLNLIKNAVKFTSNGYVEVSLSIINTNLYFEIIDSGIGISDEDKEKLFTDFYQTDATPTRKYGGTGLGLAISKNLAKLLKGEIGVKNNPEGGSIFWFTIPLNPVTLNVSSSKCFLEDNTRILIVDNFPKAAKSFRRKIYQIQPNVKNLVIESASSGEEALFRMRDCASKNKSFDIVFIDMIMPEMDGWRLASTITDDKLINNAQLYLIIPEGNMGADAKMKLLQWFNGYIYKPVKHKMLINLFEERSSSCMDLEVVKEPSAPLTERKEPVTDFTGFSALVVEDHPVNQKLFERFLQKFNISVNIASNGQEAVDAVRKNLAYDIIFMDIQMPIKNGIDATIEIKELGYKGKIIACTANTDTNSFEEYYRIGMIDTLVKPFKRNDIQNILVKHIGKGEGDHSICTDDNSVWDNKELLSQIDDDIEMALDLLDKFTNQTEFQLNMISSYISVFDFNNISKCAHAIKGSAGQLCATRLHKKAAVLEQEAIKMNHSNCRKAFLECQSEYSNFLSATLNWKNSL